MNRRNYQRELERIIAKQEGNKAKVLLHCCCGPCSSSVLERLADEFELSLLWYNPNIYPEAEYEKRKAEQKRLIGEMDTKYSIC